MKKNAYIIYICISVAVCIIPLLAMTFHKTEATSENKTLKELPHITDEDGSFNVEYMTEMGDYFSERFAYRQELVSLNGTVVSKMLETSTVEDVIAGKNDWLFYSATLDDFRHDNSESERMLYNMAHNVKLMQDYCEDMGAAFVFTIAPNKNSLYGQYMPSRYQYLINDMSDAERLAPYLVAEDINYVDLFDLFENQDEILYYRKDSHWNNKGAVLSYNALLDKAKKEHERYDYEPEMVFDYIGDLNNMLYANLAEPEMDYKYVDDFPYIYTDQNATVEDTTVETVNESAEGNLLMYRDSFGNSLLPYMASEFGKSYFSKVVPYPMTDVDMVEPTVVIVEKVERHLPTLAKIPPVMLAMEADYSDKIKVEECTCELGKEGEYLKVTGKVTSENISVDSPIYVEVCYADVKKIYSAFCVSSKDSDYGFVAYLPDSGDVQEIAVLTDI